MSEKSVIRFSAQVAQVKTSVDGGYLVTLGLSEQELKAISKLLECRKVGVLLEVAAVPVKTGTKVKDADETTARRKERYPYRKP